MLEEFKTVVFYASIVALSVFFVLVGIAVGLCIVVSVWNALEEWSWNKTSKREGWRRK